MISVNYDGIIKVEKEITLSSKDMKALIKKMVAGEGEFNTNGWIHSRWSTLYNVYDMMMQTDVRADHELHCNGSKLSRLEYLNDIGMIGTLFSIASTVYPLEFEKYVVEFI